MSVETAVILAGGKGERLLPITRTLPKALVPVEGVPMLKKIINQLGSLGVQEIIVLTGYLSSAIENYCRSLNERVKVTCIKTPTKATPSERLLGIEHLINKSFLLLYCDNLVIDSYAVKCVLESKAALTFLVEERERGNVKLEDNSRAVYFSGNREVERRFVELGYILVNHKSFFDELKKFNDLQITLEFMSHKFKCELVKTSKSLVSTSTIETYRSQSKKRKTVILDRDGILLHSMPPREYVVGWEDYRPIEETWTALKYLADRGVDFIVATNQPGVATGQVNPVFLDELHAQIASELMCKGVNILAFYVCPHHWNHGCACRKPEPGLLIQAISDFNIDPADTIFIGDDNRDFLAAQSVNVKSILIGKKHSLDFSFSTMDDALPSILELMELA